MSTTSAGLNSEIPQGLFVPRELNSNSIIMISQVETQEAYSSVEKKIANGSSACRRYEEFMDVPLLLQHSTYLSTDSSAFNWHFHRRYIVYPGRPSSRTTRPFGMPLKAPSQLSFVIQVEGIGKY